MEGASSGQLKEIKASHINTRLGCILVSHVSDAPSRFIRGGLVGEASFDNILHPVSLATCEQGKSGSGDSGFSCVTYVGDALATKVIDLATL